MIKKIRYGTILFVIFLALLTSLNATADVQCMARLNGSWTAVDLPQARISVSECAPSFSFGNPSQTYRLGSGPTRVDDRFTCQWEWVGTSQLQPGAGVPVSIACNLFLSPENGKTRAD